MCLIPRDTSEIRFPISVRFDRHPMTTWSGEPAFHALTSFSSSVDALHLHDTFDGLPIYNADHPKHLNTPAFPIASPDPRRYPNDSFSFQSHS